jgi:phage baseplate assembly protein W
MWYDIDMSFEKATNGDLKHDESIDAIENSLGNIFKTRVSSRRQLYPFASPVWYILFEQIDEEAAQRLGREFLNAIERWETRITVENIHITPKHDDNMYVVTLTYLIKNEGDIRYTYTDILRAI